MTVGIVALVVAWLASLAYAIVCQSRMTAATNAMEKAIAASTSAYERAAESDRSARIATAKANDAEQALMLAQQQNQSLREQLSPGDALRAMGGG